MRHCRISGAGYIWLLGVTLLFRCEKRTCSSLPRTNRSAGGPAKRVPMTFVFTANEYPGWSWAWTNPPDPGLPTAGPVIPRKVAPLMSGAK